MLKRGCVWCANRDRSFIANNPDSHPLAIIGVYFLRLVRQEPFRVIRSGITSLLESNEVLRTEVSLVGQSDNIHQNRTRLLRLAKWPATDVAKRVPV